MRHIAFALMTILFASPAWCADIFVDNISGDDRNTGSAAALKEGSTGPIFTIAKALRIARKGDRIVLKNTGVPYRESITLQGANNSGLQYLPFIIEGNGAVLDGRANIPLDGWKHATGDIYCFAPTYKSYQQLYIEDRPAERAQIDNVADIIKLQPLQWSLVDGMIFFRAEKDHGPGSYNLTYSAQRTGITLYEVRHVKIVDLTVQGFQLDGINVHSNCYHTDLIAVTSRGNGRSGVSVGGASRATISKSLLGDNGTVQLRGEGFSKTTVIDCTLLDNTAPATFQKDAKIEIDGKPISEPQAPQTARTPRPLSQPGAPGSPLQR